MLSLKEVLKLSKKYNVIPVYKKILADMETPLSAYLKIDNPEYSFLLESIEGGEQIARYSFLGREPKRIVYYKDNKFVDINKNKKIEKKTKDPLYELKEILKNFKAPKIKDLPNFYGGAIGYIGYDIVKLYNKVPDMKKKDTLLWPDLFFMFTDVLMVFDHIYHKIIIINNIFIEDKDTKEVIIKKYKSAKNTIEKIIKSLKKPLSLKLKKSKSKNINIKKLLSKKEFKDKIKKTVGLIRNGEVIQVVLSQRFKVKFMSDPINIYRSLRTINPSPYMHYFRFKDNIIIGASPELLVKVENNIIEVRPIAGTRKRGRNEEEDKMLERELLNDEKERAEHLMLVDLGRNDVGKVAKIGSVKVDKFMYIEKYSHVMHIVSNVKGIKDDKKDIFDVFKSAFPAGTVSGAPKVRAMQIIEEMENIKRGPYAGAVGIISFTGDMEFCISIRTIYYSKNFAYVQSGAGIVADSIPEKEYIETINKSKAMINAIRYSLNIED